VSDPATFANDKNTVGSGPFIIKSYAEGQSVVLKANTHFWRGAPKISGITYVSYKNTDAAVQGLITGEVDLVGDGQIQPSQFDALKGKKNITVNSGSGRRYTSLNINSGAKDSTGAPLGNGNPALKDVKLRTAIVMAIDNKTLLSKVKQGLGTQGQTEVPPVYPDYFGIAAKDRIGFDPAAANALLDKAGYPKGADGIRTDHLGKPLQLRLLGRSSDPTHAQMAEYIKPWLADIGIGVTVTMEGNNQVNDDSTLGKYDMYFTGFGIGPDPDFQLSINTCDSRPNADGSGALSESNWCSPTFDKLYTAQHTELDPAKRQKLVTDAFGTIYSAAVNDVIWYGDALEAYRSDRFTGFVTQPAKNGVITGQNGYWGYYSATPVSAKSAVAADAAGGWPAWGTVLIIVVVLLAAGTAVVVIRRRRVTADDRE
jgi:peptide/nickel transport system substrate-binding protein